MPCSGYSALHGVNLNLKKYQLYQGVFKVYANSTSILTIVTGFLNSIGDINQSIIS